MGVILFLGAISSGRPVRNSLILLVVVLGGYLSIPRDNFERLDTMSNLSEDESAAGRFANWDLSWQEALEHPLVGVGPDNHVRYNNDVVKPDVQVRSAHSVYFQVLGELGFPGLALFLLFFWVGFWSLFRTWRQMIPLLEKHPDLTWVHDLAFWMVCGCIGYMLGAGLLNMLYIEFPWYAMMYGSMLLPLVNKELAARQAGPGLNDEEGDSEFQGEMVVANEANQP
jgi:O-antigen ligase